MSESRPWCEEEEGTQRDANVTSSDRNDDIPVQAVSTTNSQRNMGNIPHNCHFFYTDTIFGE